VTTIGGNLERVRSQIVDAAQKSGRSPDEIELVAISKTHDADKVRAALDAGQTLFGESRVQEARAKIPELPSSLRWHFVGHLQKNKIRYALPLFELFHGIDSLDLARDLNRIAEEDGMHPRILLEVNVAGEGSKFGFKPETLRQEMEQLLSLGRLSIEGLMTIPPLAEEAEPSSSTTTRTSAIPVGMAATITAAITTAMVTTILTTTTTTTETAAIPITETSAEAHGISTPTVPRPRTPGHIVAAVEARARSAA